MEVIQLNLVGEDALAKHSPSGWEACWQHSINIGSVTEISKTQPHSDE